jgi:hypothetical protein
LFSIKANTKKKTLFSVRKTVYELLFQWCKTKWKHLSEREHRPSLVQQFPEKSHPICNDSNSGWWIVDAPCSFKPLWYPQQSYSEHQAPILKPRDTDCAKICTFNILHSETRCLQIDQETWLARG